MIKARFAADSVTLRAPNADELAFMGAAYALSAVADVIVRPEGRSRAAWLRPRKRGGLKALARAFEREYENQRLRWSMLREGRALTAQALRRALELDDAGAPGGSAPAALPPERLEEIARLLAEAQGEPRDPRGVSRPWEEARRP